MKKTIVQWWKTRQKKKAKEKEGKKNGEKRKKEKRAKISLKEKNRKCSKIKKKKRNERREKWDGKDQRKKKEKAVKIGQSNQIPRGWQFQNCWGDLEFLWEVQKEIQSLKLSLIKALSASPNPTPKRCVSDMTQNYFWWWGSISGYLGRV